MKKGLKKRTKRSGTQKKKGAKLGQHFLTAQWAANMLAEAVRIEPGMKVLEIGPGTGNLTKELLRAGGHVIAIEKDSMLVETLRTRFAQEIKSGALQLLEEDIRNITPESIGLETGQYILAANIPYYITGEIIKTFLSSKFHPARMALLVQKEVAQRIAREKKESILSLSVKVFGTPHYVKTVSKGCFSPPPSVDSAILLIDTISHVRFEKTSEKRFFEVVKRGFASKRKMIGGNLKEVVTTERIKSCGVTPQTRAENIPLEKWLCFAQE